VSGADGRFSVLVPEEDRARLSGSALRALVAARAAGHAPSGIVTVPATGEVELRMRGPEAVLRGRVTDPSGAPLAGVRVDVGERLRLGYGHLGMQSRSAASYPGRLYPGLRVVKTGALFQGFEQGRGYLGAQVLLADGAQSRLLPAASTLTGADGRYELRGLEAGAAPLELCCAGYSPVHDALVLCADEPVEHDVTLRPAARLRGELRRVDGPLPAGSTVVYAYPTDERRRQSTRARRGRYLFDQFDAGRYLLYAEVVEGGRAVAAASAHVDVRPGRGAIWNAELSSAGRVEGRLVGPGGQGLAGWQVEVALEENPPISIVVTRSAEDGSFELGILPPRPWQVRAFAPGAEFGLPLASATGTGAPAEPLLLRVTGADARLARARGQLRLPDGAPAPPGFDVLLYPCAGTGERAVLAEVRGAAGEFESPPLPPGAYHVVLPELGLCHVLEAPIDLGAEDVALGDIALPRTGRLSVAAPAQAPQSARVRIERVLGGARGLRLAIFDGRADLPLRAEVGPGLYAVSFPELERQGAPDFVRVESLDVSGR
jgi:hypothetical protein